MNELIRHSVRRSVWHGWGDPTEAHPLSDAAWGRLAEEIGADRSASTPPVALEEVRLAPSRLDGSGEAVREALAAVVGAEHVHTDRTWRVEHAGGKSYPDLYRLRTGDGSQAPDAVVVPGSADEVATLLRVCVEQRVAVVPFGGGTSVVGGVGAQPDANEHTIKPYAAGPAPTGNVPAGAQPAHTAVITLDLRRLNRVVSIDRVTRVATFEPGLRGPEVEEALHPYGLTLGHYPQSHQQATLGGYVATRSAGQASTGYGRIDDNVVGARVATPRGELVLGGRAPASAAGPRLLDVVVGSEGALGVITEATLRVAPLPKAKRHSAWFFPSFAAGAEALRHLAHEVGHGVMPDVCRLSDEDETRVNLTLAGTMGQRLLRYAAFRGCDTPSLLVLVWEGAEDGELRDRQRAAHRILSRRKGHRLPAVVAKAWEKGRFSGPYLRDELMDHRIFAETLETATTWDNLGNLHAAVGRGIRTSLEAEGRQAIVMCHVSHVYEAGASLYYTFISPASEDPMGQWREVKQAACDAIIEAGGTITHHHAVGTDHRAHLATEIGDLGVGILRAIKDELDPTGILNPGKLIPELPGRPAAQAQLALQEEG